MPDSQRRRLLQTLWALPLSACGGGGGSGGSDRSAPSELRFGAASHPPGALPEVSTTAAGSAPATEPIHQQLDALMQAALRRYKLPGATVVVRDRGRPLLAKGYGYADLDSKTPMRPEHRMHAGSLTKEFMAAATMLLVEDGRLVLDEKISRYLGAVPETWREITLRQLLGHTAGLMRDQPGGFYADVARFAAPHTADEMLALIASYPMQSAPGTGYSYSNMAYYVLGILIGKVSGQHFSDVIQQRIFKPLGMDSARRLLPDPSTLGSATGHALDTLGALRSVSLSRPMLEFLSHGGGSLEMNVLDMAKWDAALTGDTILKASSRAQMWTPHARMSEGYDIGLGFILGRIRGQQLVSFSGGMPSFTTSHRNYPEAGLSVIVFCNLEANNDVGLVGREVIALFRPELAIV